MDWIAGRERYPRFIISVIKRDEVFDTPRQAPRTNRREQHLDEEWAAIIAYCRPEGSVSAHKESLDIGQSAITQRIDVS